MFEWRDIDYVMRAHSVHALSPKKAVRLWDGTTPYYIHPFWCATTFLTEMTLPADLRRDGSIALLYHDVLEDTCAGLPDWLSGRQAELVHALTFPGGTAQEIAEVWGRQPDVRLMKLYDKVSNVLDGGWMSVEKAKIYRGYVQRLLDDVVTSFGEHLVIVALARGVLASSLPATPR